MRRARGIAALGALLTLSAFLFALPSLYLPGLALLLLGPGAAAWVWLAARGATVGDVDAPPRVQEGERFEVAVPVRPGRCPLPGGALTARGVEGKRLPPFRRPFDLRAVARLERRGRRPIGPAKLSVRDPLGLAERTVSGRGGELLVLPRVEPIVIPSGGSIDTPGRGGGRGAAPEVEPDALTPHRDGTPASRIHWPTVARTGDLMDRRLLPDSGSRPVLVLDASAPEGEDALDRAVRAAASLCVALAAAGGCLVLLPGDRRATFVGPELRAWPALHARLALVGSAAAPPKLRPRDRSVALFWVTAGHEVPAGLARFAAECYVVSTERSDEPAPAFSVAGCHGRRLGRAAARAA